MVVEIFILIAIAILVGVSLKIMSEIRDGIDRLILVNEEIFVAVAKKDVGAIGLNRARNWPVNNSHALSLA